MSKAAAAVPDAWDDDWEAKADSAARQPAPTTNSAVPSASTTKPNRLVQHAESNRRIWESADSPQTFHYLEASNNVPLASGFKPQVKVLSRKPMVARRDPISGRSRIALEEEDDEGAAGQHDSGTVLTSEQIRAIQKKQYEEKQRRYDEARAKIFGESTPSSRGSSPGNTTPPRPESRHSSSNRGRARAWAQKQPSAEPRQQPPDPRRQLNQLGPTRELYDPNHAPKPDLPQTRRGPDGEATVKSPSPKNDLLQPLRAPRGPDGSGRGFTSFRRGGRET